MQSTTAVLSESELPRLLADSISAMLAYWDASLRCRFANRAYERWFGVTPEALLGKHISELLGPLYAINLPYIEGALRGEPQEFEREIPDPAGGPPRHSLANYIPHVVDGAVHGFFVLVTDISAVKRAELALRESEERFRLTIDEAPIGMALVAPDGRFIRVNRALCELVGYSADELTGLTFQAITHPEDLDADLALAGQLARGEIPRYTLEKRYIRKDGSIVDIMLSGSALRGPDGAPRYYIAQIEDCSARKQLERELRLAEARSSGILAISADAIVSVDEDQRITMFNAGAEKIFGRSRDEAIGAPLDILIPERLRATHRRHVMQFAREAAVARQVDERGATLIGLRQDGTEFPADAAISKLEIGGKRIFTVALRDVTEQKRVEKEQRFLAEIGPVLATSLDYEETLTRIAELAVQNLADLCIIDIIEGDDEVRRLEVTSRDPSRGWLCEMFKRIRLARNRPYLLGSVLDTRQPVLMQRPSAETLASLAQSEEHHRALLAAEIRSMVAVPLIAHDELVGAMAFVSSTPSHTYGPADVRLAEGLAQRAALSIANARLFRAAQRAKQARDDVLGVVAHDLGNPLNNILLQAAVLRRRHRDQPRTQESLDAIEESARRMQRMIQDLLDFARMEVGRLSVALRRVSAPQVVTDAFEAQQALAAEAAIELHLDLASDLPDVLADPDRLLQVFQNLIGNALKFTPPGGRVTVTAAPRGGEVLFSVTDTGIGIAEEHIPRLFDRFWQAKRGETRGAGLGLSIAKGVVEAHRGRIWVESEPGVGSTFFFTIPAAPES